MKVLLIQPPVQDFYQTAIRTQPIGLAYVAASLQSCGHEVEILDCRTGEKRPEEIPSELTYLKEFYPFNDHSPFRLYTGYYHFGMNWEHIKQQVMGSDADLYGISSSFTPYHGEALAIARIIKEWNRNKIVVMGGAHVSVEPEVVLQSPLVDYVVLGEGEVRLPLLVEQIEKHFRIVDELDGVGYRVNGKIYINRLRSFIEDLDSLPHPARGLLDLDRYRIGKLRSTMIVTSRGCPHECTYCSTRRIMGSMFRMRSPENIIEEMQICWNRYGIRAFDIEDDNFTFDRKRALKLAHLIIEHFGEGGIELAAMNGISFVSLDGELLTLIKRAGFKTINLSLVSVEPSILMTRGRPGMITEFDSIVDEAAGAGLNIVAYAVLGMPGQSIQEMVETLCYLMGKRVLIGPSVYYPNPGTPLFEECLREGVLPPNPSQWRSSAFPIETKDFSRLDLVTLFRLVRVINFVKRKMDEGLLSEGMSWKEICQVCKDNRELREGPEGCTWINLLLLLLEERHCYSVRKDSDGKMVLHKEPVSQKVLDLFFASSWEKAILRSKQSGL